MLWLAMLQYFGLLLQWLLRGWVLSILHFVVQYGRSVGHRWLLLRWAFHLVVYLLRLLQDAPTEEANVGNE